MGTRKIKHSLGWIVLLIALVLIVTLETTWAKRQPPPKAKVLQPKAGQELTGNIYVHLKLPAKLSGPVYAGLGGPPWVKLEQLADANEWRGQLNSRMVPNGNHNLIVKTTSKRADTAVSVKVKNPLEVYFADLHSHTGYSDGTLLPIVAHDYARNVAKLDVFLLTDHLEQVDDTEWLDMREAAWDACEDGKFVAIPALEWTKKEGHLNIFDPKTNHWPEDLAGFYKAAADAKVVCKFNHPGRGDKVFGGLAYSKIGDRAVQLMEVRKEDEEQAYIRALKLGWHIAPDGSDDTHRPNWGSAYAWSGILAPGLSKRNVLHALKSRHCYSTLDRNCVLLFKINGATMGDIITDPVETVSVVIAVQEPDVSDLIARIELFEDGVVVQTDQPNSNHRHWKTEFDPKPGKHYYFVKVTQKDGNLMWSAPVWVTVGEK
ncbi:MAG: CehA/McbA family metallohydrolase [Planctomycetota bacterium]|jgi:hypothetical protein